MARGRDGGGSREGLIRPGASSARSSALRRATVGLGLAIAACGSDADATGGIEALRVGFIGTPDAEAAWARRGAELGAEEAAHAASLVGRKVELVSAEALAPDAVPRAVRELLQEGVIAIIGGFDELSCHTLADLADHEGFLFLNVGCREGRLRSAGFRNAFHVEASDAMYAGALEPVAVAGSEPRAVEPATDEGFGAAGSTTAAPASVIWHADLTRYGAAQLNERFERRFGRAPEPPAWPGWMAVKVVWEAVLRTRTNEVGVLAGHLASGTAFDGHKGQPLTFDPRTRQLRQPLFELPDLPVSGRRAPAPSTFARAAAPRLPPEGLPDGPLAFVSDEGTEAISIVDLVTRRRVAEVSVGARPRGIHVAPDGTRVYVALSDMRPLAESDRDAIAVIDIERLEVVERYRSGSDPEQFGLSPDGRMLYASNEDAGTASITDLGTGEVTATLIVGVEPEGVAVSPDGRWVYVTAETSNTVSVIDAERRQVVASFMVGARPRAAAFAPDGQRAYVTNEISGTITVVDVASHRVVGSIDLGPAAKPVGVAVSPEGRRIYVANGHAHTLSVVDAATSEAVANVPVGRRPWGVALSADGRYAYTANGGSDDISVVDLERLAVVATVAVGERPWGIAVRH